MITWGMLIMMVIVLIMALWSLYISEICGDDDE